MAPLLRLLFSSVIVAAATSLAFSTNSQSRVSIVGARASASRFSLRRASERNHPPPSVRSPLAWTMTTTSSALRIRGGGDPTSTSLAAATAPVVPAAPAKKIRIDSFDSLRFFLIGCIVLGHFVMFANPSSFVFQLVSQHNVAVGGFFALGGYVTAYTSTEQGKREPSPKLLSTPKPQWILSRIFGYFPLHLVVLALFSPMFLYTDVTYSGWPTALFNAFLSVLLLQAWFPMRAEIWNAPTWYLSALNFITAVMPFAIPPIARMDKKQLRKTAVYLWLTCVLPKIGYLFDHQAFALVEGVMNPKNHPNWAIFNLLRFSPLFQLAEVLLGAVACRLVMLDDDPEGKERKPQTNALSTFVPMLSIMAIFVARASNVLVMSEFITRYLFFLPLFLRFLMSLHRNAMSGVADPINTILNNKLLVWLGNLSFPIFIVHGPIGQIFFKKLIATKLWGQVLKGPQFFGLYLTSLVVVSWILQKLVLQNKAVGNFSKKSVDKLSEFM